MLWLGLNNSMMYAVILLGAVRSSIAIGLVAGVDQTTPAVPAGRAHPGATGPREAWHIVMPGAPPGYLAA